MQALVLYLTVVIGVFSIGAVLGLHLPIPAKWQAPERISNRRDVLWRTALPLCLITTTTTLLPDPVLASLSQPLPKGIKTVILESANVQLGVQLEDVPLGDNGQSFPVVKSVAPTGMAHAEGVVPGMIVLGQGSARNLVQRLQRGPYPYAIQFYDASVESTDETTSSSTTTAEAALQPYIDAARAAQTTEPPALSARGTGLVVKTTRKASDCTLPARSGDTVTIVYEGRVASPGGPIYDSTLLRGGEPVTFRLGEGKAIAGVEIGIGGMCQGEVRELDIPSALGYGRFGSDIFDVPGDVRLWWKVELLKLVEGEKRFPFR